MEDTSSASSDSDNALLSPKSRSGCNAATQTPEMPRHDIKITQNVAKKKDQSTADSSIVVYKLDTQKPLSKLEQDARTLAIPDVVVEYIKDSFTRQDTNEAEAGTINPAFEPQELIVVRTSSSVSLRDDANQDTSLGISKTNKLYYSLPRTTKNAVPDNVHSQIATPKLEVKHLGVGVDPSLYASSSSLGYPRSIPPSPNFGYRPLESESSAIYTIIAPVKYVPNGNEKESELKLIAELRAQLEMEKKLKRKFEFTPAPLEVDRRRQRLQCCTDVCSTMFLIPGILIAIVTPISLIPMFMLPLSYYIPLIAIFITSGIVSVLSLAMSGLMGNIVWHYDSEKQRLKPRLHCGKGPLLHFWGNGFYPTKEDKQPLNGSKIV